MIILLSPSKSMTRPSESRTETSLPPFLDRSSQLIDVLRGFSVAELMAFMSISEKLAELNHQRFKDWALPFSLKTAAPALFSFSGDVYDGLAANTLPSDALTFAESHLRILSGLYGLLGPLDLILPYRLEMGRPLQVGADKNLYAFWRSTLTQRINEMPGDWVLNLASIEYFKVLDKRALNKRVVSPVFKDEKNGQFKIISFYAKKARGLMARYMIENQLTQIDDLRGFSVSGYTYDSVRSTELAPVFTRSEAARSI